VTTVEERQSIATTRWREGMSKNRHVKGTRDSTELARATWKTGVAKGSTKKVQTGVTEKCAFIGSLYQAKPERQVPTRSMVTRKMLTKIGVNAQARRHHGLSSIRNQKMHGIRRQLPKKRGGELMHGSAKHSVLIPWRHRIFHCATRGSRAHK